VVDQDTETPTNQANTRSNDSPNHSEQVPPAPSPLYPVQKNQWPMTAGFALLALALGWMLGSGAKEPQPVSKEPAPKTLATQDKATLLPTPYLAELAELQLRFDLKSLAAKSLDSARKNTDDPRKKYVITTRLANIYLDLNNKDAAIAAAKKAHSLANNDNSRRQATQLLIAIQLQFLKLDDAEQALKQLSSQKQLSTQSRSALADMWAELAVRRKNSKSSIAALQKLSSRFPKDAALQGSFGLVQLIQDPSSKQALQNITQTLLDNPDDTVLFRRLTEALPSETRLQSAGEIAKKIIQKSPKNAAYYCEFVRKLCVKTGKKKQAFYWLERSLIGRKPGVGVFARLALAAQEAKLYTKAAHHYGRARSAATSKTEKAGYALREGESLWLAGMKPKATELLKKLNSEGPEHIRAQAANLLERLQKTAKKPVATPKTSDGKGR
jgi:hypothetical protein